MNDLEYWIWLSKIEGLGSIKKQKLLEKYKHPKEIWKCKKEDLLKVEGIGEKISEEILNSKYRVGLKEEIKRMEREKVQLISIQDKEYPEKLKKSNNKKK